MRAGSLTDGTMTRDPGGTRRCLPLGIRGRMSTRLIFHHVHAVHASNCMLPGKEAEDAGEALDIWMEPGVPLMVQRVRLRGRDFPMVMPDNVDAVMDWYIEQGLLGNDPYWARLWPAGVGMARLLLRRPHLVAGLSVCEVGAGLGLPGLAAAFSGARSVVLTDREPMALTCALLSARASGLQTGDLPCKIEGDLEGVMKQLQQHAPDTSLCTVSASCLDWNAIGESQRYDTVLACDVLYETGNALPLSDVAQRLLRSDGGRLILADPMARTPYNREEFLDLIQGAQKGPRILEEVWEDDVVMEDRTTRCSFIIGRSSAGTDTVGVKLRRS
eukprot:jgi/Botrbrau1/5141/Bobra.0172s0013.1